ncbi:MULTISPECIES: hypothetical protein [unclassified Oleiphilus]|uniref:hypothetical protein n=1 Tax=unclassified Oleiphilus TaxID=2631174 RepID=UPI0007C2E760|nr:MULTISPECIES: hypothetical protein [unclassified Oleiphilus]KZY29497.1 hypothetical protein A3729_11925 [Oleiphilus sp. HI0043]KZZ67421.1 hypothetical protein A3763_16175 [Oleiphilus sp. HI0128]
MISKDEFEDELFQKDISEERVEKLLAAIKANEKQNSEESYYGKNYDADLIEKKDSGDYGIVDYDLPKYHAPILNVVLQSTLFRPIKSGRESEEFLDTGDVRHNKGFKSEYAIHGSECNSKLDFIVYATLLRLIDQTGFQSLIISPNAFIQEMGFEKKVNNTSFLVRLDKAFKRLESVVITLTSHCPESTIEKNCRAFELVKSVEVIKDGLLEFKLSKDFFEAYRDKELYHHRAIDMKFFSGIGLDTARSLFLLYESWHDSSKEVSFDYYERDRLIKRCNLETVSRDNNRTARLKEAHEKLIECGYLAHCDHNTKNFKTTYYVYINGKKTDRRFTKPKLSKADIKRAEKGWDLSS